MLSFIIFSKDRPCQLDLLLRSIQRFVHVEHSVRVLTKASEHQYKIGYGMLAREHQVEIRQETVFKDDTLNLVMAVRTPLICFLVDDCVFINDLKEEPRLGPRTSTFSLRLSGADWDWTNDDRQDYRYPYSLDGDLFRTLEVRAVIGNAAFTNPNELEDVFQARKTSAKPFTQGFIVPKVVNIPDNLVNLTHPNPTNGGDAQILNHQYLDGFRIDLDDIVLDPTKTYPFWKHHYQLRRQ